jgi:hypothetical protein
MAVFEEERQKVLYFGNSGYTQPCLLAISAILNSGILPERATIISHIYNSKSERLQEEHLFVFWNWQYIPVVVIPSGFASGYGGEGPKGFALAICMIKEKGIPLDGIFVEEPVFNAIDKGRVEYTDAQIIKDVKSKSESLRWPCYDWVPEDLEDLLERGQLHRHLYLQGYDLPNPIKGAISNVDLFDPDVGKKLRLAEEKISNGIQTEDWQNAGLLIRDSWIELSQSLCEKETVDISEIEKDKVIDKLKTIKLDDRLLNLAKSSFALSFKVHHDREITKEVAIACVRSSIFTMQSIILKYIT